MTQPGYLVEAKEVVHVWINFGYFVVVLLSSFYWEQLVNLYARIVSKIPSLGNTAEADAGLLLNLQSRDN